MTAVANKIEACMSVEQTVIRLNDTHTLLLTRCSSENYLHGFFFVLGTNGKLNTATTFFFRRYNNTFWI